MPEESKPMSWEILEYHEHPKGFYWHLFWGVILALGAVYAIMSRDFLFGVILIIAGLFAFRIAFEEPKELSCRLDMHRVIVNETEYPLSRFSSFEIYRSHNAFILYLFSKHLAGTPLILPLHHEDVERVRAILKPHLQEVQHQISFLDELYHAFWH